ncbi:MAG: phage holin family protein [Bacteroidetes bacterium]|nr:phage holin family protein [Bacteroidota bacterium]MBS1974550.1 phage holin family protein [Bacteroidota bacterium]
MNFVLRIIITAIVAFGLSYVLKGIHINEFTTALLLALVLALLNAFLKPLLIILTLPITLVTFGLFLFVINAGIIMLASEFIEGFRVDGFWWALLFSLLLSALTSLLYKNEARRNESHPN